MIARTYNSLGQLDGDNNDGWRTSVYRKAVLTGTLGATGSKITRTDWDGSEAVYTWDSHTSAYIPPEGETYTTTQGPGAYDKFVITAEGWECGTARPRRVNSTIRPTDGWFRSRTWMATP